MNLLMKRKIKNISKRVIRLYSCHFVCLSESFEDYYLQKKRNINLQVEYKIGIIWEGWTKNKKKSPSIILISEYS